MRSRTGVDVYSSRLLYEREPIQGGVTIQLHGERLVPRLDLDLGQALLLGHLDGDRAAFRVSSFLRASARSASRAPASATSRM